MATVLFTDIVDSTRSAAAMGATKPGGGLSTAMISLRNK
jgi:hypothetical protein